MRRMALSCTTQPVSLAVQRLTRYPLLIAQIVRYTKEHIDPDEAAALRHARATAQQYLDTTNESIRQRQSDERLASLSERLNATSARGAQVKLDLTQPTRWMGPRRIVREEVLSKQRSGRKICVLLCNDVVLLLSGGTEADERLYRMPLPLQELVVGEVPAGLKGRGACALVRAVSVCVGLTLPFHKTILPSNSSTKGAKRPICAVQRRVPVILGCTPFTRRVLTV